MEIIIGMEMVIEYMEFILDIFTIILVWLIAILLTALVLVALFGSTIFVIYILKKLWKVCGNLILNLEKGAHWKWPWEL